MKNLITTLLLACIGITSLSAKEPSLMKAATFANKPQALCFIENKGQFRDQYKQPRTDIDIKLDAGNGLSIFIGDGVMHYQWSKRSNENSLDRSSTDLEMYRMDVVLVGANKNVKLVKEEEQAFFERYYTEWSGEQGVTAHSYQKAIYKDVYPKIDWVLYTNGNGLKYDFIVHSGGNPADIKLRYEGATALALEQGALKATTPMGTVTEAAPYSYEVETKKEVFSAFNLQNNILSFDLKPSNGTVIIDPALAWASYYGSDDEIGYDVATDAAGNAYMVGHATSTSNIATTGTYQTNIGSILAGITDGMLIKFNNAGQRVWGSYYGGNWDDWLTSIAIDGQDRIYVAGKTISQLGIASTGAHQTSIGGGQDCYIARFNTNGQRQWGSYYGGSAAEVDGPPPSNTSVNPDIATDISGNVYMVSQTNSLNNIATAGTYQPTLASASTAAGFIVKFNASGVRQWGSYFDGDVSRHDGLSGVATDPNGNVYTCGYTRSLNNIATTGAHQTTHGGAPNNTPTSSDGLLAKFNSTGGLIWTTYYGGTDNDEVQDVICDANGNIYIAGKTISSSNIATTGAHQASYTGPFRNNFLVRLNSNGVRQWGTYIGGGSEDDISLALDGSGNIYLGGGTGSNTNISTSGVYQTSFGGYGDAYLMKFSSAGIRQWGTYLGAIGLEGAFGIALNYMGDIFCVGTASVAGGIATPGAHQTSLVGSYNAFIAKFNADTLVFVNRPFIDTLLCINDSAHISYSVTRNFNSSNTFTLQLSDASGSFISPVNLATINGSANGVFHTKIPASVAQGTGYRLRIVSTSPARTSPDNGVNIRVSPIPNITASSNSPLCPGDTLNLTATSTTPGIIYSWTGPNSYTSNAQNPSIKNVSSLNAGGYVSMATAFGCVGKQTVNVVVKPKPVTPTASNSSPICGGAPLDFTASSTAGSTYSWIGPNGYKSTIQNPSINPAFAVDSGIYKVVATLNGCISDTATTKVVVNTVSSAGIYVSPNDTICPGGTATFVVMPQNAGVNPQVQWYINGNPVSGATANVFVTTSLHDGDSVYCRVKVTGVCSQVLTIYTFAIKMHVIPGITIKPEVTVTSIPVQPRPGEQTTFTATSPNAGANPGFQWQRNGVNVFGATYATYTVNNLTPYEEVRCILTSNDVCASPKNDTSSMIVANFPTGIEEVKGEVFSLYPNPNKGSFTLKGTFSDKEITVEVLNAVGQVVYSSVAIPDQGEVKIDMGNVAKGVYLLKVGIGNEKISKRFTVQ